MTLTNELGDSIVYYESQLTNKEIKELKEICFVCNSKKCRTTGGFIITKMEKIEDEKDKKTHIISRFAPLGCYLANNKKEVMDFYKDKKAVKMWKNQKIKEEKGE